MDGVAALVLALSLAGTGLLCWAVSRAGASGALGPNGAVGIRTRATRRSEAAWRAGHAAAVRPALMTSVGPAAVSVPGALLLATGPGSAAEVVGTTLVLVGAVACVGGLVLTGVLADRAARRTTDA